MRKWVAHSAGGLHALAVEVDAASRSRTRAARGTVAGVTGLSDRPRPADSVPPSAWDFPPPTAVDDDLVAVGADLEPGTVIEAYRRGLFPMPLRRSLLGWWSPDPRGVLPLTGFRESRSLRRSRRRFEVRVDTAFDDVIRACADPARPQGWISAAVIDAYTRLFELGWAHSFEAFSVTDGSLAGGLYGIAIGGLFAAESMFHSQTDAGKAALASCVELLADAHSTQRLFDVQWATPHLETLGVISIPRDRYLARLEVALTLALPSVFDAPTNPDPTCHE